MVREFGHKYDLPVPIEERGRGAGSDARSTTSVGASAMSGLVLYGRVPIDNLRLIPIVFLNEGGGVIAEVITRHAVALEVYADRKLRINSMDFQLDRLLDVAARKSGINAEHVHLR
jgi:hypothetical protein